MLVSFNIFMMTTSIFAKKELPYNERIFFLNSTANPKKFLEKIDYVFRILENYNLDEFLKEKIIETIEKINKNDIHKKDKKTFNNILNIINESEFERDETKQKEIEKEMRKLQYGKKKENSQFKYTQEEKTINKKLRNIDENQTLSQKEKLRREIRR